MPQKLALKRLTKSDLTLFDWHFKNHPAGNQKGTNLNANVFISRLYPAAREIMEEPDREHGLPLELRMFGPGLLGEYIRQRKVLGGSGTYKNYRIDGETVHNPDDEPGRFNVLIPGDLVVMSFRGELYPVSVSMIYIAQNVSEDVALYREFAQLVDDSRTRSMAELSPRQIREIIERTNPNDEHPIYILLLDDALEDAAQSGIEGILRLRTKASKRRISQEALRRARENAGRIGRYGEEFVYYHFAAQKTNQQIVDFRWIADENAIAPYDFEVSTENELVLVDVKSTEGSFDNPIHISYNELLQMREAGSYDLYRVYEVGNTFAKLRIARGMKEFAEVILPILEQLPNGVRSDSISVSPDIPNFGSPLNLHMPISEE